MQSVTGHPTITRQANRKANESQTRVCIQVPQSADRPVSGQRVGSLIYLTGHSPRIGNDLHIYSALLVEAC
jgi:hypothetical protein